MNRGVIGIYAIRNTENGKVYIGQSVDVEYRISHHFGQLRAGKHHNEHLQRAYELNPDDITWELLETCKESELDEREIATIAAYDSTNPEFGYNMQYGGQAEHRATPETRRKMSESKKGKKFTKEHRRKISEANRGVVFTKERRAKISSKRSRTVYQFDLSGNFIASHKNSIMAAEAVGLKSCSAIKAAASGRTRTSGGYRWSYEPPRNGNTGD